MKVFKPLVAFLVLLVIISITLGLLIPNIISQFSYSSIFYLGVCFGTAAHFLEEYYTKAWLIESELRKNPDGTPKAPLYDRAFFVAFSHAIVLLSFIFYFPIAAGYEFAFIFGLGITLNGILNGVIHTVILIKFRRNTGFISGIALLIFGFMVLFSLIQ